VVSPKREHLGVLNAQGLPLFLPLAILMACTNWLSYKTAFAPQWPAGVRERLGPVRDAQSVYTPLPEPEPPQKAGKKRR
jgi:hypothetical protein